MYFRAELSDFSKCNFGQLRAIQLKNGFIAGAMGVPERRDAYGRLARPGARLARPSRCSGFCSSARSRATRSPRRPLAPPRSAARGR